MVLGKLHDIIFGAPSQIKKDYEMIESLEERASPDSMQSLYARISHSVGNRYAVMALELAAVTALWYIGMQEQVSDVKDGADFLGAIQFESRTAELYNSIQQYAGYISAALVFDSARNLGVTDTLTHYRRCLNDRRCIIEEPATPFMPLDTSRPLL